MADPKFLKGAAVAGQGNARTSNTSGRGRVTGLRRDRAATTEGLRRHGAAAALGHWVELGQVGEKKRKRKRGREHDHTRFHSFSLGTILLIFFQLNRK
jgi:hypothetical protein